MILSLALMQEGVTDHRPSLPAVRITEARARAMSVPDLARVVLGPSHPDIVEAVVSPGWHPFWGGSILFAARPRAAGIGSLCAADQIEVSFDSETSGPAADGSSLAQRQIVNRRFRWLESIAGATSVAVDRACRATSPALTTVDRAGFFVLHCVVADCDLPRTAWRATTLLAAARARYTPSSVACVAPMTLRPLCTAAIDQAGKALATGFPALTVGPCIDDPATICVTASVNSRGAGPAQSGVGLSVKGWPAAGDRLASITVTITYPPVVG